MSSGKAWETPRNLAIVVATVAVLCTALGYKLGTQPQIIRVQVYALPP